jgi:hypothetical protein
VRALARTPYPQDATLGPDLDILVTPSRTAIDLVNRTPRNYRNVQLWLNQQFVGNAKEIVIGEGQQNRFTLESFINRRGDHYPVGGILSPDKGFPVVLAELFDPATGKRHRVVVERKDQPPFRL